jgi:hypothetical protein
MMTNLPGTRSPPHSPTPNASPTELWQRPPTQALTEPSPVNGRANPASANGRWRRGRKTAALRKARLDTIADDTLTEVAHNFLGKAKQGPCRQAVVPLPPKGKVSSRLQPWSGIPIRRVSAGRASRPR